MIPRPAQYLLRFDDLCPTIAASRWEPYFELVREFGIRPILAVIPDNRDHELQCSVPDPEFWARMRALETAGATIALHGYRHLCLSTGKSLVPLYSVSEFAGVPAELQMQWISAGLQILRGHGLDPRIWVAPRHGFDQQTLQALRDQGIGVLSDGLARVPFLRGGMTWIPQQLWAPVEKSKGLWTICVHPNSSQGSQVDEMRAFLLQHAAQFTSVERVLREFRPTRLGAAECVYEACALWRVKAGRARKRLRARFGK
ncbi:MAG: DUF2334 domain-containing protein [Terracidiphilus sp.]